MRFTRGKVNPSATVSSKDGQCTSEFGDNYRAASTLDVDALYQSMFVSGNFVVTDNTSYNLYMSAGSAGNVLYSAYSTAAPVACVLNTAPLQFTRSMVSPLDSTANKDASCVAELGEAYQSASGLDISALYQATTSSGNFVLNDYTTTMSVYIYGGYYYGSLYATLSSGYSSPAPVACARK